MDQMAVAFERAGFPTGVLAFASACYDLARLALNQQADPVRAAHAWLGMASGRSFRDGPLAEFLTAVARDRQEASSAAAVGQGRDVTQPTIAPSAAETSSDAAGGQASFVTQVGRAPAASETSSEPAGEAGHGSGDTQSTPAPSPARSEQGSDLGQPPDQVRGSGGGAGQGMYKEPTPLEIKAMIKQRQNTARVMSGVYLTDSKGERHPMDDIYVSSLGRLLAAKGKQVAENGVEYNTLYLVKTACEKPALVPPGHKVGDVLEAHEIRHMQDMARAFARSPMVRIPQSLRHFTDAA